MALDPADIEAIGRAVAAAYGPYALGGLLLAIIAGVAIALKVTAPEARRLTIAEIKDPKGELAKIRAAERAEMLAAMEDKLDTKLAGLKFPEMPNFKELEGKVDRMRDWMNEAKPLLDNLTADKLEEVMRAAYSKLQAAERARKAAGKGTPQDALEEVATIGAQAAEHPEAAMAYKGLLKLIDLAEALMPETEANARKIAKARAQAERALEQGEDLIALKDQFASMFPMAYANFAGQAAGGAATGGASGGGGKLGR